jgi:hypothetical protein
MAHRKRPALSWSVSVLQYRLASVGLFSPCAVGAGRVGGHHDADLKSANF